MPPACTARTWQPLLVLCGLLWGGGAVAAQSLAELARQEEARRATIANPSPVYSDSSRPRQNRQPAPEPPPAAIFSVPVSTAPADVRLGLAAVSTVAPIAPALATVAAAPTAAAAALDGPAAAPVPVFASVVNAATAAPRATASAPPNTGGTRFQIQKTPEELAEAARRSASTTVAARTGPSDARLPRQHDVLRVATGVSYLQGADFGLNVSAAGKINGMQTAVNGFFTAGPLGLLVRSGRVSVFSPDGRWRGEGGDLYSDLGGLVRGGRVSFHAGERWTPSVSLYVPAGVGASGRGPAVAYRDRYQLLPRVRVGGELTSEGSTFLQAQYAGSRLNATAFSRESRGLFTGHDKGIAGGGALGRGVAVAAALRLSDVPNDSRRWQLASLRLPLPSQASVTLERTWWTGSAEDGSIDALVLQLPLGKVRVMQRLQRGRTDYLHRAVPFGFNRRQSQSLASYAPGPWGSLHYQQSAQWFDDGRVQQWEELSSIFQVSRHTSLQVTSAFPDLWEPRRFRARVTHELSPTLRLEAQYGRLSAFQLTRASVSESSKAMITIRKSWQVQSPTRGAEVSGRTVDQAGHPVVGALVRLGPYSAITDEDGTYLFPRVPQGDFELALDRNKLPAAYAWDEGPRSLHVTRGSRVQTELHVIPLNAIRGRVYVDRNSSGTYDEGEGVPNVVVRIGDAVTATDASGAFAFYNQPPGRYVVRLDASRLANGFVPASSATREIDLAPDAPALGVDFVLEWRDRPVIMRRADE